MGDSISPTESREEPGRPMLELRHFRYFLAVTKYMNFRHAAAHLDMAQPALSQQIQILERIVGARLFDRTSRSVSLTQAGVLFHREAVQTIQQADRAKMIAERAGRGELGRLVVAYAGSTLFTGVLSSTVYEFHKRFRDVNIEVVELGIGDQLEQIDRGDIDIGILRLPLTECPESVSTLAILEEPILLAIRSDHPLARKRHVDVGELATECLVCSQLEKYGMLRQVFEATRKRGFVPKVLRARHFGAIVGLVSAGLGIAVVPASAQSMNLPEVVYRQLRGVPMSPVAIAYHAKQSFPPLLSFLDIARSLVK